MALSHAILASVLDGPMTGYVLARQFSKESGFFWRATHQQIYLELTKLERRGYLEAVTAEASSGPTRVPRRITDPGRAHLLDWVARSTEPASIKDDILVKCMALGLASRSQLAEPIAARRTQHVERLAYYRSIVETRFPAPNDLPDAALGRYLALTGGVRYETAWIDWADDALRLLLPKG